MSTKTQGIINLVKIKSWYLPQDAESYQLMKEASVPLLIFHKDFLPTLQLATKRHKLHARETLWADLYETYLDKIGAQWKSRNDRSCKLGDTRLVFLAKATSANRKSIAHLEASLSKFFARWAFSYWPLFSETRDQLKLVVETKFDPGRLPITPIVVPDQKREYDLVIGFTKIRLTFYDKASDALRIRGMVAPLVLVEVFTQTGSDWTLVHQSATPPSKIGDITSFIPCVGELFTRMKVTHG